MAFNEGDKVSWKSQANGSSKEKHGVVVQFVPAGGLPERECFPSLYNSSGVGFPRNHDSYVVQVGKKYYWPRVKHLQLETVGNE